MLQIVRDDHISQVLDTLMLWKGDGLQLNGSFQYTNK